MTTEMEKDTKKPTGVKAPSFVPLGRLLITAGADAELCRADVHQALRRHVVGDWGNVCDEDKAANDRALEHGDRLLSAYTDTAGIKFWIITEWDRSLTTVLLPDEY